MKIIKASIDLETWVREVECQSCNSTLEISANDIWYQWTSSECYYVTCCLCKTKIYFKTADLPKIVQIDVTEHRVIQSNCSSDW